MENKFQSFCARLVKQFVTFYRLRTEILPTKKILSFEEVQYHCRTDYRPKLRELSQTIIPGCPEKVLLFDFL